MSNQARYEEGTLIVLDQQAAIVPAEGWEVIGPSFLNRVGSLVGVHTEMAFSASAAPLVGSIPLLYAPAATLTDTSGLITLSPTGELSYSGSTVDADVIVAQFVFAAAENTP